MKCEITGGGMAAAVAGQAPPNLVGSLGYIDNRFGYGGAGYMWDPYLGVYHVRNRVYDPYRQRWHQRDPIGFAGGPNLYQYCMGDPLSLVDPLGLRSIGEYFDDFVDLVSGGIDELIDPETGVGKAIRAVYDLAGNLSPGGMVRGLADPGVYIGQIQQGFTDVFGEGLHGALNAAGFMPVSFIDFTPESAYSQIPPRQLQELRSLVRTRKSLIRFGTA